MMGSKYLPPTPKVDLTGKVFGRLKVLGVSQRKKWGKLSWDCLCDCGNSALWNTADLNDWSKQSCGCWPISEADMRAEWRHIEGLPPGREYEVSDTGKVRHAVLKNVLANGKTNSGYYRVILGTPIKGKVIWRYNHRLVAAAFIGDVAKLTVNHRDGNKLNNQLSNLEICTQSENLKHAYLVLGRKSHNIALTKLQADEIREQIKLGVSQKALAKKYGVSQMVVSRIKNNVQREYV